MSDNGRLVAIDPGVNACGVAVFEENTLVFAGYVRNRNNKATLFEKVSATVHELFDLMPYESTLAIEIPRVYQGAKQKGDPNDLIALALVVGGCSQQVEHAIGYYPDQWKGQVPKPKKKSDRYIIQGRVFEELTVNELILVPKNVGPAWDVIDAIGIGLFHLGRMRKGGV